MIDHNNLEEFADPHTYDIEGNSDTGFAFYTALAQETRGPVLEIACGTGRVSIPIARLGFAVTGLDIVPGMLELACSKSAGPPTRWVAGDARAFDLGEQSAPKTIDEYIAAFPRDVQEIMEKIRLAIRKAAPDAKEAISYQIPTFTLKGNLVHFAAFKKHIGFYPTPTGVEKFKSELSVYEGAKGSVRFPLDKPIPFALISKIVTFRVKENLDRAAAKEKKK